MDLQRKWARFVPTRRVPMAMTRITTRGAGDSPVGQAHRDVLGNKSVLRSIAATQKQRYNERKKEAHTVSPLTEKKYARARGTTSVFTTHGRKVYTKTGEAHNSSTPPGESCIHKQNVEKPNKKHY